MSDALEEHDIKINIGGRNITCHFHISVCLRIMDLDCRGKEQRSLRWDGTRGYWTFCTRTMLPMRRFAKYPTSHWRIWWTPDPGQKKETKMVWLRRKIFWFSKDTAKGHSDRKRKNRQTGEEVGRQYQRVYWNGLGSSSRAAEKQNKVGKDCCEFICGAPTIF